MTRKNRRRTCDKVKLLAIDTSGLDRNVVKLAAIAPQRAGQWILLADASLCPRKSQSKPRGLSTAIVAKLVDRI